MMSLLLIAENIGSLLSSILVIPYVIEETLVRSLFEYIKTSTSQLQKQETLLQFLLAVLQEEEQNTFLNTLLICLQRIYRRTALSFDFENQKCVLKILHLIFSDAALRKYCLKNILFQKESCYRILSFVSINCIDKISFKNFVDLNYWSSRNGGFEIGCRQEYYSKVKEIGVTVQELRDLQVSLFSLLLTADDAESYNDSSRALFLLKFRNLIKNQVITSRPSFSPLISTSVFHSFFTICLFVFNRLWKMELEELPSEKTIKPSIFFDDVLEYFEIQRLGGLESHLKKQHASELKNTLDILKQNTQNSYMENNSCDNDILLLSCQIFSSLKTKDDNCLNSVFNVRNSQPSSSRTVLGEILVSLNEGIQKINVQGLKPQPVRTKDELQTSLLHLFDGTVLLYHHSGHKYMEKVAAQTDAFFDNVKYYEDLQAKIKKYMEEDENYSSTVLHELRNSAIVMDSKLKDQCYHHAWNLATVLSLENTKKMLLFLKIVLGALQESSKIGCLFTFVPDFYIETLTQVSQDLNCLISCDQNSKRNDFENFIFYQPGGFDIPKPISQEYFNLLKNVGEFLALHFSDPRIVYADSKDFLIQALAGFVCQRPGLEALESIPVKSREAMIISLLKPYENRAWAQNNWILVRFWKGKGFGFRFTKSPHLNNRLGPKPTHYEIPNVLSYAPYPSDVFLHHTSEALKQPEISTPFLNSLLNQLNWVFSEFIGMLQEMAVSVAPNVFLDPNRQDSKPLLTRLIQVLCQVLNRVSFSSGCFSHVVNLEIPGLETIHYFPMLTAVIGIICSLLKEDIEHGKGKQVISPATKGFLDDPSFQMNSIYSFVGGKSALRPAALYVNSNDSNSLPISNLFTSPECDCKRQKFCLRRYPDSVSEQELRMVVNVINHLEKMSSFQQNANIEDNDSLCTICYASSVDAIFVPCGHTSCTQYLMNQTDCFFCMKLIELVKDNTGKVIYTSSKLANPP
ncbi:E3 ubiquitin-protein ligase [Armadillidium nasatum]|uniref:E3 ubiquitin-protein ligase n=1 Tax=Armadillidium nasatum TaxID=96803 RepID=A0A5N5T2S8_9CRUS|nr:E3 ubiquitin-protein ligase [Armadillidium nasatum]